jgi:hypothetical protein
MDVLVDAYISNEYTSSIYNPDDDDGIYKVQTALQPRR